MGRGSVKGGRGGNLRQDKGLATGDNNSAGEERDYTLVVTVNGPGRAELSVDGSKVSTDAAGSHQIPKGAKVAVSGRARSGGAWQGWQSGLSAGNTTLLYMTEDTEVVGVAVDKSSLSKDKDQSGQNVWVDPLGANREEVENNSAEIAQALLEEAGLSEKEAASLALSWKESGFSELSTDKLSAEDLEFLKSLRPAIISRVPDGLSAEEALHWLRADTSLIADPEASVPGMEEAGRFLADSIAEGKKIAVFSDFDVDGITSAYVLRNALEHHGAEVELGLADVGNGFGLNEDFVRQAHASGCEVLVTADCGSASEDVVALAQELGMQVIVSDHHSTDGHEDNPADFHLNPDLHNTDATGNTGSQVAWKLAESLHRANGSSPDSHMREDLWMAGFGCRADGGDLLDGENRAFINNGTMPEGVRELGEALHQAGRGDNVDGDMSDLDATRQAINLAKRMDHIETMPTEEVRTSKGLPEHRHVFDHESGQYKDVGPRTRPAEKGDPVREDFSAEDVIKAISHPDPAVREESQGKVMRAFDYHDRLQKEAEEVIKATINESWQADDGTIVRDPSLSEVTHIVFDDDRMRGMSRPIANSLQSHTRAPSVAFVPAGKDEDGNDLVKFSATPVQGQSAMLGEAMPEIRDLCSELGGHDAVFGGVCRREDIPEVMSRLNSWASGQGGVAPDRIEKRDKNGPVWVAETRVRDSESLEALEKGRGMLAPYTENFHTDKHFAPSVSLVGTISDEFVSPPDGTDDKGNKVQAASRSRTHYGTIELEDGTKRRIKVGSKKALEELRKVFEGGQKVEVAVGLKPTSGDAHSVRAVRPAEDVPF